MDLLPAIPSCTAENTATATEDGTTAPVAPTLSKDDVLYFADDSVTDREYTPGHAMRPVRLRMLHSLIQSLHLDQHMTVCTASPATPADLLRFHSADYVNFLMNSEAVCSNLDDPCSVTMQREYGTAAGDDGDCPLFPHAWEVVSSQCGASLACADALVEAARKGSRTPRVTLNWSGGMHHAASCNPSGFCYANDIALCIHRLLTTFQRVLYIDIDVHHGDAVQYAFETNRRVFTLSLHQFGAGFYPGTGEMEDNAQGFAINVPLQSKIGDRFYYACFAASMAAIMSDFAPEAVVLQCGADCVFGDPIGGLQLSTACHARCIENVISLGLPTVVLGGGGYHVCNTARTWAIGTAAVLGLSSTLPEQIPTNDPYFGYYRQEDPAHRPKLHVFPPADPVKELKPFLRKFLPFLRGQMRGVRAWRSSFPRAVRERSSLAVPQASSAVAATMRQFLKSQKRKRLPSPPAGRQEEQQTADSNAEAAKGAATVLSPKPLPAATPKLQPTEHRAPSTLLDESPLTVGDLLARRTARLESVQMTPVSQRAGAPSRSVPASSPSALLSALGWFEATQNSEMPFRRPDTPDDEGGAKQAEDC